MSKIILYTISLLFFITNTIAKPTLTKSTLTEPTVTTGTAQALVTQTFATLNGNISGDGGNPIMGRGFVYSSTVSSEAALVLGATDVSMKVVSGTEIGGFSGDIVNLTAGTEYIYRAYATNTDGTSYGYPVSFTTRTTSEGNICTTHPWGDIVTGAGQTTAYSYKIAIGNGNADVNDKVGTFVKNELRGIGTIIIGPDAKTYVTGIISENMEDLPITFVIWDKSECAEIPIAYGTEVTQPGGTIGYTVSVSVSGTSYTYETLVAVKVVPEVKTIAATSIITTSATLGGMVITYGGVYVTANGFVYSSNIASRLTIEDAAANVDVTAESGVNTGGVNIGNVMGTGIGSFKGNITTGLTVDAVVYYRAYATNSEGTGYGGKLSFTPAVGSVQVNSLDETTVETFSAIFNGEITSTGGGTVSERGFVYLGNSEDLTPQVTADESAQVAAQVAADTDATAEQIADAAAIAAADLAAIAESTVTKVVITPESGDEELTSFAETVDGLEAGTTYNYKFYATNSVGTVYGDKITFTTGTSAPIVTTGEVDTRVITEVSGILKGTITSTGGDAITESGFIYSSVAGEDLITTNTSSDVIKTEISASLPDEYRLFIGSLTSSQVYYYVFYSINSEGTTYGEKKEFIVTAESSVIGESFVTKLTTTSATLNGHIVSLNGGVIDEYGFIYYDANTPVPLENFKIGGHEDVIKEGVSILVSDNIVVGDDFSKAIGEVSEFTPALTAGATYNYRSYVKKGAITDYGDLSTFVTYSESEVGDPTVVTYKVVQEGINDAILNDGGTRGTSVIVGGSVTSTGGLLITGTGIIYSLVSDDDLIIANTDATVIKKVVAIPDVGISVTLTSSDDDNGGGYNFEAILDGLVEGTTYYYRAYAINSNGIIVYGGEKKNFVFSLKIVIDVLDVTKLTTTSATLNGEIVSIGGEVIIARGRGFIYAKVSDITVTTPGTPEIPLVPAVAAVPAILAVAATSTTPEILAVAEIPGTPEIPAIPATLDSTIVSPLEHDGGNSNIVEAVSDDIFDVSFNSDIADLTADTEYRYRPYAKTSTDTIYGDFGEFSTYAAAVAPLVSTDAIITSNIVFTTAAVGGKIISTGGSLITETGFIYSFDETKTLTLVTEGLDAAVIKKVVALPTSGVIVKVNTATLPSNNGIQHEFTGLIENLINGRTYYYVAYASNSEGTNYGEKLSFATNLAIVEPTVSTVAAINIAYISATLGGNMGSNGGGIILERGFVYSDVSSSLEIGTGIKQIVGSTGIGPFTLDIMDLTPERIYYYRAYARNSAGINYGNRRNFTTPAEPAETVIPTLTTTVATEVTSTGATLSSNISSDGGGTILERGFVYSTTLNGEDLTVDADADLADKVAADGTETGDFSADITGLMAETQYYYRAYARNSAGTGYGEDIMGSFTTGATVVVPTLGEIGDIRAITSTGANLSGNISSDGGATILERGFVYSNSNENLTVDLAEKVVADGTEIDDFSAYITGLSANTIYYYKAYATNSEGTGYSVEESSFTTLATATVPTVSTIPASAIARTGATLNGNIISDGGATITDRGFVYSDSDDNLTIENTAAARIETVDGRRGIFRKEITNLTEGSTYYYKAYARNSVGIAYGAEMVEFITRTTAAVVPTVSTGTVGENDITSRGAVLNGNTSDDGGAAITARGFVYSTSDETNLTIGDAPFNVAVSGGTDTDDFSKNITGLTAGSTYYFKAYATNSVGTGYGEKQTFMIPAAPTVTTEAADLVTSTTATLNGDITSDGGETITERGFIYSILGSDLTIPVGRGATKEVVDGTEIDNFSANITGLTAGTLYYYKAYATNSLGTNYGGTIEFTTSTLGNKDFEKIGFTISPNPTRDILNITVVEKAEYKLLNIKGQILKKGALSEGKSKINLSPFAKGVYLLNIKTSKGSFTGKVVRN